MIKSRIRYNKLPNNLFETKESFVCGKMICKGYYIKDTGDWFILNLVNNRKVIRDISKSEDDAKKMIKKSLKVLGARFVEEVRATKENQTPMLTDKVIDEILKQKEGK
jgi:hypothetical protein